MTSLLNTFPWLHLPLRKYDNAMAWVWLMENHTFKLKTLYLLRTNSKVMSYFFACRVKSWWLGRHDYKPPAKYFSVENLNLGDSKNPFWHLLEKHTLPHCQPVEKCPLPLFAQHLGQLRTWSYQPGSLQRHSAQSSEGNRTDSSWRDQSRMRERVQKKQSVWKHKARQDRGERQAGVASELSSENEPPSFRAPSVFQTALGSTDYKLNSHDDSVHHVSYVDTNQSSGTRKKGPDKYKAGAMTFWVKVKTSPRLRLELLWPTLPTTV